MANETDARITALTLAHTDLAGENKPDLVTARAALYLAFLLPPAAIPPAPSVTSGAASVTGTPGITRRVPWPTAAVP